MDGKRVAPRDVRIKIRAGRPVKMKTPKKPKKRPGFTNRLAIYILLFLAAGLIGSFILAWRSITYGYTGALMCWSIVFTPIGTAVSIVLSFIVQKSRAENTGPNGEGVIYAKAVASNFVEEPVEESPAI